MTSNGLQDAVRVNQDTHTGYRAEDRISSRTQRRLMWGHQSKQMRTGR